MSRVREQRRRRQDGCSWIMERPLSAPMGFAVEHGETLSWGDWARQGGGGASRCASAEGRYISGYPGEDQPAGTGGAIAITEDRAQLFERAVLSLPHAERRFLVMAYVNREWRKFVCSKCRIDSDLVEAFQVHALRLLVEAVDALEQRPKLIRKGKMLWAGLAPTTTAGI